jgi:protocatechuate 3,4-dioxygenase beta subunit
MRAPRIVVALALAIVALIGGLWVYNAHRVASVEAPAPATTSAVATTGETPSPDATDEKVPAAHASVVPAKTSSASALSASFSTFRGRIIDAATRQPVREFVVEFLGTQPTKKGDEAPGARTFTSEDGRFEWDFLPPGQWAVTISASGYQRFDVVPLRLKAGESTPELVVPMRRGHVLRGRVYDEGTGVGIADATVQFREEGVGRWEGNFRMRPRVNTAKDGSFELDGVPAGRIKLVVHAQDHAGKELDVTISADTPAIEIALSTGGTISGRLTAADGVTPVIGEVGIFNERTQAGGARRTGNAGEFAFAQLEPGRYRVSGRSETGSVVRSIALVHGQRIENLVLAVGTGRAIRGVVSGVTPDLLRQVTVAVQRGDAVGGSVARVDELGAYALTGVMPGRVVLVAEVPMRVQLSKQVVLTADSDLTVDFAFPRGARVSGRVTRRGQPVPNTEVYPRPLVERSDMFNYGARTSREGEYVIEQLAPGDYHFYAGTFRSKLLRVSGDTVFDIEIPDVQVSGRVLEAGKVPVVGAHVELWDSNPDGQHVHVQEETDHFGNFELVGIEPGDYTLTAYKPGYSMYREPFTYTSPSTGLVLPVQQDRGVEVRVRLANTGELPRSVYVVEQLARQHGTRLLLRLDEYGVGYLPTALSGRTLSFASGSYAPVVIRDWSGQALDLTLVRSQKGDAAR